jgi:hypothetical protein
MRPSSASVRQTMRNLRISFRSRPRSPKKQLHLPGSYGRVSLNSHVPGIVTPGMSADETTSPEMTTQQSSPITPSS